MTTSPHMAPDLACPVLAGQSIEVRWTAITADTASHRRIEFVLEIHPVDGEHALLEAWLETPSGQRTIMKRGPVACTISRDDELLHLDAHLEDRRIVALSIDPRPSGSRILFARSDLLERAGLAPGAYDPPTGRLLAAEKDVASA